MKNLYVLQEFVSFTKSWKKFSVLFFIIKLRLVLEENYLTLFILKPSNKQMDNN